MHRAASTSRWTERGLLADKPLYDETNLIHAAVLDQLTRIVKPALAQAAWVQIRDSLDINASRIEVVISPITKRAFLIAGALELDQVLPRDQAVTVVALGTRISKVRTSLADYLAAGVPPTQHGRDGPQLHEAFHEAD